MQVMAYEACREVMEALRAKYSGPLQVLHLLVIFFLFLLQYSVAWCA